MRNLERFQQSSILSKNPSALFPPKPSIVYRIQYPFFFSPQLAVCHKGATTPDKTVETFQYNFQFRAMVPSCLKETNSPHSPPLMQCCFGLAAQACISCVTANNIAIGEGGESLLICDSKHFCQGECKKIGILVMCLNRFCPRLSKGVFRLSLTVMSITASHCHIFRLHA